MTPQERRAAEQIRAGQTAAFRSSYAWQQTVAKSRLFQDNVRFFRLIWQHRRDFMTPQERRAAEQIRAGQTAAFRSSYAWQQTAAKARLIQHNECQDCRARGLYAPAEEVHHVQPVEVASHRALDMSNLRCLCRSCHRLEHGRDVVPLTPERW